MTKVKHDNSEGLAFLHNATCVGCGLHVTLPYAVIWEGPLPWQYVPYIRIICPYCNNQRQPALCGQI